MRHLLTLGKDERVVIDPHLLSIKCYRELWDRDKSKDKKRAVDELGYIYFMHDFKSYFGDITDMEDRHKEVCKVVFEKEDFKIDKTLRKCIDIYKEDIPISVHILEDAKIGINALREYFKNVDLLEMDDNNKPKHDSAKLTNNLTKLNSIIDSLEKLEDKVKRDIASSNKVTGGREKGFFED